MIPFETKGGVVSFDDCITQATEKLREAAELFFRAAHIENSRHRTDRGEWFKQVGLNLEQTAKISNKFANQSASRMQ